jgi:hypothetical protein
MPTIPNLLTYARLQRRNRLSNGFCLICGSGELCKRGACFACLALVVKHPELEELLLPVAAPSVLLELPPAGFCPMCPPYDRRRSYVPANSALCWKHLQMHKKGLL